MNMRAERARKSLTTKEVAQLVGVSANQISNWELEKQSPSAENIIKLSHLYGCSPEYLMLSDGRIQH
ncbi:helix-turn-helix domain-containing protein [Olegusella massiliensis]|uniref:helix-turn-helix domain-containing protein n=1 Tax=Olegusella massiliensis TaxID=1776381 RepID=UPI0038CD61A8